MPYNFVLVGFYTTLCCFLAITLYFDRIVVGDSTETMSNIMYNSDLIDDTIPPEITNISTVPKSTSIIITFSETLNKSSAENIANYNINQRSPITSAKLGTDNKSVILNFSQLTMNKSYKLTINNIYDLAEPPNKIVTNTEKTFEYNNCLYGFSNWQNYPISAQNGIFNIEFDAIPKQDTLDGIVALSSGQGDIINDFALLVRFNDKNQIDVSNSNGYSSII